MHLAMIWVMVVAKTMCHVVRKRAVTQVRSIEVLSVSVVSCRRRGLGGRRSYGSLYEEDVSLAVATRFDGGIPRQLVSQSCAGRAVAVAAGGRKLTEFCGCQNPFVEDNNTRTAGNPDTAPKSTN